MYKMKKLRFRGSSDLPKMGQQENLSVWDSNLGCTYPPCLQTLQLNHILMVIS